MDKSYYPLVAIAVFAIALIIAVALFLVLPLQPLYVPKRSASTEMTHVNITLYAGEISDSRYGFGTEPNNLTSPGPTLRFKTTDVVNLTIVNVGTKPHAFQVTNVPQTGGAVLFDAAVASANVPLQPGESGSVVFNPYSPGKSYYYTSPLSGQAELGMWGSIIVL
jgi:FtsP/CotA-like multicopper oxidase with cupredoxin domain